MSEETPKEEKAIVRFGREGIDLQTLDDAIRFANGLIQARMAPRGMEHPGAVVGIIQAGKEVGLPPMFALSNLTFVNGRVGMMGKASLALVRKAGVLAPGTDIDVRYVGDDEDRTCIVSARRFKMKKSTERAFAIKDAIRMGLLRIQSGVYQSRKGREWLSTGPWALDPDVMLMWRAWGRLADFYFSDVIGGLAVAEVLRDIRSEDDAYEPPVTAGDAPSEGRRGDPVGGPGGPAPGGIEVDPVLRDVGDTLLRDLGLVEEAEIVPPKAEEPPEEPPEPPKKPRKPRKPRASKKAAQEAPEEAAPEKATEPVPEAPEAPTEPEWLNEPNRGRDPCPAMRDGGDGKVQECMGQVGHAGDHDWCPAYTPGEAPELPLT